MSKERALVKALVIPIVASLVIFLVVIIAWPRPLMRNIITQRANLILTYDVDVKHAYDSTVSPDDVVKKTAATMEHRLDKMGVVALASPNGGQVEVQIVWSAKQPLHEVERMLARSGRLEFRIVDDGSEFMNRLGARAAQELLAGIVIERDAWEEHDRGRAHSDLYLRQRIGSRSRRRSLSW